MVPYGYSPMETASSSGWMEDSIDPPQPGLRGYYTFEEWFDDNGDALLGAFEDVRNRFEAHGGHLGDDMSLLGFARWVHRSTSWRDVPPLF